MKIALDTNLYAAPMPTATHHRSGTPGVTFTPWITCEFPARVIMLASAGERKFHRHVDSALLSLSVEQAEALVHELTREINRLEAAEDEARERIRHEVAA
jgi:hypothetical protein